MRILVLCLGNGGRRAVCSVKHDVMGLAGRRYFTVTRPLLLSVTGAVNGTKGPSYPHGNNIALTAQLTALTNSACP